MNYWKNLHRVKVEAEKLFDNSVPRFDEIQYRTFKVIFCLPLPLNVIAAYLKSGEVGGLGCALQGDPALPVDVHDEGVRVRGEVAAVLKLNLLQCNGKDM